MNWNGFPAVFSGFLSLNSIKWDTSRSVVFYGRDKFIATKILQMVKIVCFTGFKKICIKFILGKCRPIIPKNFIVLKFCIG